MIGQRVPRPYHVVVNGWYFYTLNWATPARLRAEPAEHAVAPHSVPAPRCGHQSRPPSGTLPRAEREWREDVQPRYRAAVAAAEAGVEALPVAALPALIDELADLAGESFTGSRRWPARRTRWRSTSRSSTPPPRAVARRQPPAPAHRLRATDPSVACHRLARLVACARPARPSADGPTRPRRAVETRQAAEEAAFAALASSPRRLRAFRALLADAQHLVPVREEQVAELTIAWPVMRRAVCADRRGARGRA